MKRSTGYIKLFRSLLDWEWYDDPNTKALFIHLLLTANYQSKTWHGIQIQPGQVLTSRASLASQTGLSDRNIRTSLTKLKSTNEVTIRATSHYTLITLVQWALYQSDDEETTSQTTNRKPSKRPATDQQPTSTKEGKKEKRNKDASLDLSPLDNLRPECHNAFLEWLKMRTVNGSPIKTNHALELALDELREVTTDPEMMLQVINKATLKNWKGFFPLSQKPNAEEPSRREL